MKAIIISISSDIGLSMAERWLAAGAEVVGTYRTINHGLERLSALGAHLIHCDLADRASIALAIPAISDAIQQWDVFVSAPGLTEPIGPFATGDFAAWDTSINVNFTAQLHLLHGLLPCRNPAALHGPCALFFAGGGTNGAPINYSAYTASKIALIKACELLDAELSDTRFVIVGPGWVKTKIHDQTLAAGSLAGANLERTQEKLRSGDFTPMQDVLDCCDWLISMPKNVISGRNFSVAFDRWGEDDLEKALVADNDMYKLRRHGNNYLPPRGSERQR